jgi:hypothetical protein
MAAMDHIFPKTGRYIFFAKAEILLDSTSKSVLATISPSHGAGGFRAAIGENPIGGGLQ